MMMTAVHCGNDGTKCTKQLMHAAPSRYKTVRQVGSAEFTRYTELTGGIRLHTAVYIICIDIYIDRYLPQLHGEAALFLL